MGMVGDTARMPDRLPSAASTGDLALPEAAETGRASHALARLGPAIDAFQAAHATVPYAAYQRPSDAATAGHLPEAGIGLDAMVDELAGLVAEGSRIGAPGFVGFITTGASTSGAIAETAMAFAGGQRYTIHAFNRLEHDSLRWLAQLCGLPEGVTGVYSSGGSTANLIGLGSARQSAFERLGFNVAEDGTPAGVRGRIYASELAHRTVHRAAAVLGLGRQAVRPIPVDGDGRIRLDELEAAMTADARDGIVPVATVAIAGTTDTGSVDDVAGVAAIAQRFSSWVHVDGAYGLIGNASPRLARLYAGLDLADSWIVDPHKWLATGVGVAATFVRDEGVLTRAFAEGDAAYLEGAFTPEDAPAVSQFDRMNGRWADQGLELSAPPRGVMVWAVLREIGRAGVIARVDRHVAYARHLADRAMADPRLELLLDPQLSVACFRYRAPAGVEPDALNARILERLRRETGQVPSSTVVAGRFAIRPCYINPRTTLADVDALVDAVIGFGDELTGGAAGGAG